MKNFNAVSYGLLIIIWPTTTFSSFQKPLNKGLRIGLEIQKKINFAKFFFESHCNFEFAGGSNDQILLKIYFINYLLIWSFKGLHQHFYSQFRGHNVAIFHVVFQTLSVLSPSKFNKKTVRFLNALILLRKCGRN